MTQPRILMCPPDHFEVGYAINPWMRGNVDQLDADLAARQWKDLVSGISEVADVVTLQPQPGLPDMVFTANAGIVYRNRAMGAHFMPEERRGEEPYYKEWFSQDGFEHYDLPEDIAFEGAGDCLLDRGEAWVWTGYGIRSEITAREHLKRFYDDREVISMRLVDERFYHIDTCLCPLTRGYLLYYPEAFDEPSRREIDSRVPEEKRIIASDEDAEHFACNAVNVGDTLFLSGCTDALNTRLRDAGFKVREMKLGEFLKSGGSAKCLTLRLDEPA
ncbi:MAG: arginine deiminase-related protein [Gammaproteobacteria bacterium]